MLHSCSTLVRLSEQKQIVPCVCNKPDGRRCPIYTLREHYVIRELHGALCSASMHPVCRY